MKRSRTKRGGSSVLNSVNRLLSYLEPLAARQGVGDLSPVFIAGLPRSGTTLVYELLLNTFEAAYLANLQNYVYSAPSLVARIVRKYTTDPAPSYDSKYGHLKGLFSPAENYNFWKKWMPRDDCLGHLCTGDMLDDRMVEDMRRTYGSMSRICGRQYIFKSVYFSLQSSALLKAFPDAYLVIVERDFGSIVASMYKRRIGLGQSVKWWSIVPPYADEVLSDDVFSQVVFQCVRSAQLMNYFADEWPGGKVLRVQYKDVCNDVGDVIDVLSRSLVPTLGVRNRSTVPGSFTEQRVGLSDALSDRMNDLQGELENSRLAYIDRVLDR